MNTKKRRCSNKNKINCQQKPPVDHSCHISYIFIFIQCSSQSLVIYIFIIFSEVLGFNYKNKIIFFNKCACINTIVATSLSPLNIYIFYNVFISTTIENISIHAKSSLDHFQMKNTDSKLFVNLLNFTQK